MGNPGALKRRGGSYADGWIDGVEAGIWRQFLPAQSFDANNGFNRSACREGMAEESLRAGNRRELLGKKFLQSFCLGEIIVPCAGAVGVDIVNLRGLQTCAAQGGLHGSQCAFTFRMWRGHVVRIATGAPSCQARQNSCAALPRGFFCFQHENGAALTQTHSSPLGVERPATSTVDKQQRMKSAPGHS